MSSRKATSEILDRSNRFKVTGVHTESLSTQMVKLKAVGDWPYVVDVENPMCVPGSMDQARRLAIPISELGAKPHPAAPLCVEFESTKVLPHDQFNGWSSATRSSIMTLTHSETQSSRSTVIGNLEAGHGEILVGGRS